MSDKYYLLTPKIDLILIGGGALIAYFVIYIFYLLNGLQFSVQADLAYWMIILAFFVNSPHFMISYLIFYKNYKNKLMGLNVFSLVGIFIPCFLFVLLTLGLIKLEVIYFKYMLLGMFFLVGWHYIKQAYGCFIVYSAGNKIFYSKKEQSIIKFSLYPLWIFSFFNVFTYDGVQDYWGMSYNFPAHLKDFKFLLGGMSILGITLLIGLFLYNYIFKNKKVNLVALVSLIIIFIWLSPLFWNPYFYLVIPFFHSLQYFLFSGAYTKSKILKEKSRFKEFLSWWGTAFILGALFFEFIPRFLDSNINLGNSISPNLFLISFLLFINIHHYFIDSLIWKGGNKEVRDNLIFKKESIFKV